MKRYDSIDYVGSVLELPIDVWIYITEFMIEDVSKFRLFSTCRLFYTNIPHQIKIINQSSKLNDRVLSRLHSLRELVCSPCITNNGFCGLSLLDKLTIVVNQFITKEALLNKTLLRELSLGMVTNVEVYPFPNLTSLSLSNVYKKETIDNEKLTRLTKLTKLSITGHTTIDNDGLSLMSNLTWLELRSFDMTDNCLSHLTNLNHLELGLCNTITRNGFQTLTNLKSLSLINSHIRPELYTHLTGLTSLNVPVANDQITDHVLLHFTQLTYLNISCTRVLTDKSLSKLILMKHLKLREPHRHELTYKSLERMKNLTKLDLKGNRYVMKKDDILLHLPHLSSAIITPSSGIYDNDYTCGGLY